MDYFRFLKIAICPFVPLSPCPLRFNHIQGLRRFLDYARNDKGGGRSR